MTLLDLIKEEVPEVITAFITDTAILRHMNWGLDYISKFSKLTYITVDNTTLDTYLNSIDTQALIFYMKYAVCIKGTSSGGTTTAEEIIIKDDYNTITKKSSTGSNTATNTGVKTCEDWLKKIKELFGISTLAPAYGFIDVYRKP